MFFPLTITLIHMLDTATGWGIGQSLEDPNDHILVTADGGTTWRDVTPPQSVNPAAEASGLQAAAFFKDAQEAWVVYGQFAAPTPVVVWHTPDGGQTWIPSQPVDVSNIGSR